LKLARTKEWRESHGLTQRELAAVAGVGEVTVARIEAGASVTPPTARKVAGALGVSVADLLERPPVPLAEVPEAGPADAIKGPDSRVWGTEESRPKPPMPESAGQPIVREVHEQIPVSDKIQLEQEFNTLISHLETLGRTNEAVEVERMRDEVLAA
jgi:transcriptional regulator with XRE-family HTH domain